MIDHVLFSFEKDVELSLQSMLDKIVDDGEGKADEEEETKYLGIKQLVFRVVLKIVVGVGMETIFADPFLDAIDLFSIVSSISSYSFLHLLCNELQ